MNTYNLVFHFAAIDHPMVQWHVERIVKYLPLFNGKRIVTLADIDSSVADSVEKQLSEAGAEVHRLPNFATRECAPFFNTSAPIVESTDPDTFLFYGHGKGVSRTEAECVAIKHWCSFMYKHLLEEFSVVESTFTDTEIHACGIFKCVGDRYRMERPKPGVWSESGWHYPGTFYWVRQSEAFKEGWKFPELHASWHPCSNELWPCYNIPNHRHAADLYPLPPEFGGAEAEVANSLFDGKCWEKYYENRS